MTANAWTLFGTLHDASDKALVGIKVTVTPPGLPYSAPGGVTITQPASTVTGANGYFTLDVRSIPGTTWRVQADNDQEVTLPDPGVGAQVNINTLTPAYVPAWQGGQRVQQGNGIVRSQMVNGKLVLTLSNGVDLDPIDLFNTRATVYIQNTPPVRPASDPASTHDLWFNTTNGGNVLNVWLTDHWAPVQDKSIADAATVANQAYTLAQAAQSAATTAQGTANTGVTNAANAQNTANTAMTTANAANAAAANAQGTANSAQSGVTIAQNTANAANSLAASKVKTWVQATAPTASAVGDIWYDTSDNNNPKRWNGVSWLSMRDGAPAAALTAAQTALQAQINANTAQGSNTNIATYVTGTGATKTALDNAYGAKSRSGTRSVGQDELVLNVYDYGATNSTTVSSQSALDACYAAAVAATESGAKGVTIQIPRGAVVGAFTVKSARINFSGPGILYGSINYINPTVDGLVYSMSSAVSNHLVIRPPAGASAPTWGIRVLGCSRISVRDCTMDGVTYGIYLDYWGSATSPNSGSTSLNGATGSTQNSVIRAHNNAFLNVDYALYGGRINANWWNTHSDVKFNSNSVRVAYVSHVWLYCDGGEITENTLFHLGYQSTDTTNKQRKSDSIFIGQGSQAITVHGNRIHEPGKSGIWLQYVKNAHIADNLIYWYGQYVKSPGIRLTLYSANVATNGTAPFTVSGNMLEEGYGDGILVEGDAALSVSQVVISESNRIRLIGSTSRNVYFGAAYSQGAQDTTDIVRVRVMATQVTGWPQLSFSELPGESRQAVLAMRNIYCMSWRRQAENACTSTFQVLKAVTASTAVTVGVLRAPNEGGSRSDSYSGRVRVMVRNYMGSAPNFSTIPKTATYQFDVDGAARSVSNLTSFGLTSASGDGQNPAFTFTIDASHNLIATPGGSTAGSNFVFSLEGTGYVAVGFTNADFAALPLMTALAAAPTS